MKLSSFLFGVFALLLSPACVGTLALYLYPVLLGCRFPAPPATHDAAPFRLLALGDPQLEGDSSLPNPHAPWFPSLVRWSHSDDRMSTLPSALREATTRDLPSLLQSSRKRLDLFGNDYYLAHIYRTLHWWTRPTHVTVLGDLIGSQWVSDDEFAWRGWRFWNRVFLHAQRVEDALWKDADPHVLGADPAWSRRLINPAGNHDIGYAGDITSERLARFEDMYGAVNWNVAFQLGNQTGSEPRPTLHVAVVNSMNLDGPTSHPESSQETYDFVNNLIERLPDSSDKRNAVIAITHIPLHKPAGICVDGPYFTYKDQGIREQNHLTPESSNVFREGIFGIDGTGSGRRGLILNGHDHEGCDTWHVRGDDGWVTRQWPGTNPDPSITGLREITLRSMMGMYGGNAGLISAWFDEQQGQWHLESASCALGVQHIWWAVHIVDLVTVLFLAGGLLAFVVEHLHGGTSSSAPNQGGKIQVAVKSNGIVKKSGDQAVKKRASSQRLVHHKPKKSTGSRSNLRVDERKS